MALNILNLALSKSYTDEEVAGGGAIKGKNCVVEKIDDITGGHRVNFKWTLDNGTVLTGTMDVMDGEKGDDGTPGTDGKDGKDGAQGEPGKGIKSIAQVPGESKIIITYDDDTTSDPIDIPTVAGKDGKDGIDGQDGQDGVGVPAGGTTGQVLAKKSGTNYDTEWVNAGSYISGTLVAGNTTLTLSDESISTADTCLIDWYTNDYDVIPLDITVSNGSVTFTFDTQQSDIKVTIKVINI